MKRKTCCFTGHREIPIDELEIIKEKINKLLYSLYENGVTDFITGGALGFDTIAVESILEFKETHNDIKVILMCPCKNQDNKWKNDDKKRYEKIKHSVDEVKILSEKYYRGCMHVRNRKMVDASGYCICYLRKNSGGTYYTVDYAIKNEVKLLYI